MATAGRHRTKRASEDFQTQDGEGPPKLSPTNEDGPDQQPQGGLPDHDGGPRLRWIRRTFVGLVIFCLILAAWVWFKILGLP